MNFKQHFIWSVVVSASVPTIAHYSGNTMSHQTIAVVIPSIIAGGLYPDVDCASIPSRIYAIAGAIISIFLYFTGMLGFILLMWIPFLAAKMSKHRGFTHSIWFPIGLIIAPFIINKVTNLTPYDLRYISGVIYSLKAFLIAFSVGLLTHIFLDSQFVKKIR